MEFNRRAFSAGSVATLVAGSALLTPSPSGAAASAEALPWYRRIRSVGQTNFNERDPELGDVQAWADYWASAKVQAIVLSVSGPVAFYPTKVPFFHVSDYLKGRDFFGECVAAAKERGLRVIARMSPDIQYTDPALLAAHPLWFRRDKDGALQSTAPNIAFTCQFSGHYTEQQPAILRELNARYDIDGAYMNGWPSPQVCYCDTCRRIGDPESAAYKTAVLDNAKRLIDLYRGIVREKNPDNFFSYNVLGGMEDSGLDQWLLTRDAQWFTSDNQGRQAIDQPVWQAAQQVKFAHALMGDRAVAAATASYTRSGQTMWRQVADTTAEPLSRMAQTAAAGGIVWYHQLGLRQGFAEDRRWQKHGRDFLPWLTENDRHFRNRRSLSTVAMVVPSRTMSRYRLDAQGYPSDYLEGAYAALIEARVPFDLVHENDLTPERLGAYELLVLPNFAWMSDRQAAALSAYAQRGGSLLATFQTGLYDQEGRPRPDFALGRLFGIAKAGEATNRAARGAPLDGFGPMSAQLIRQRGEISKGFEDTTWIAGPSDVQPIKPTPRAAMTFIEPYPAYPPEAVYQRKPPSDSPSLVLNERGRSRFAYMAGDMDATFWRLDNPDIGRQFTNTIDWLLRGRGPVSVRGEGLLEVIAWQTEPGYAVHLLNYNGANAFKGHMRPAVTLGQQDLRLNLADERPIRRASLLWSKLEVPFRQTGTAVELAVPKVGLYEVVALET